MVHDRRTRKVAIFGGFNGLQDLGDSWIWDGRSMTWVQAAPIHCPKAVTVKQDTCTPREPFLKHALAESAKARMRTCDTEPTLAYEACS
jgi:hypothetical protein